jgi:hypothetical protein
VGRATEFLSRTAEEAGAGAAVPLAFPVIEQFPRAEHWSDWAYQPALNPTAGLVGLLYQLGVDHPWREAGAAWCWQQLDAGNLPGDGHAVKEVLVFLEHTPERESAARHAAAVVENLPSVAMFHLDPDAPGYGVTPLDLAPLATSAWRTLFPAELIDGHLDRLERAQQEDGGWPISWDPPSEAARFEWRGIVTLGALRTLTSYGRLAAAGSDRAT